MKQANKISLMLLLIFKKVDNNINFHHRLINKRKQKFKKRKQNSNKYIRAESIKMSKMNLGSQSISNESQGFGDYRYQKALKEISKLINVNRQIKLQSERFREQNEQLHNRLEQLNDEHQQLIQEHTNLQQNMQLLSNQYEKLSQEYVVLEDYCKKAEYEQKRAMESSSLEVREKEQIHQRHLEQIEDITSRFHRQMNQLVSELRLREHRIQELQARICEFNQLESDHLNLRDNYNLLLQENYQLKQQVEHLNQQLSTLSSKPNPKPDEDLLNKLKINEEWIKSLNEENYNLKQKLLEEEYKKQKDKCSETIFHDLLKHTQASLIKNNPTNAVASQLLMRQYSKQFHKKLKKLEEEKSKLEQKCSKLKSRNHELEVKSNTLEKQVNLLIVKVNGYEQLTERQQKQIQKMIEEYHKEMDRIMNNKNKIPLTQNSHQQQNHTVKQHELNQRNRNLKEEIQRSIIQMQQKNKLIKYLEQKISAFNQQRIQIIQTNKDLQQELSSYQNMDLSKTSKNYSKADPLIKTQSLTKNGKKVFVINGKKYETVVLKNGNSIKPQNKEDDEKQTKQDQKRKIGDIEYLASIKNYGVSSVLFVNQQRA